MTDLDRRAERGLLSLLITDTAAAWEILRLRLRSNDFISLQHRAIWLAAVHLYERNEPIDVLTVIEETRRDPDLESVPAAYVQELAGVCILYQRSDIPSMAHVLIPAAARTARRPATAQELMDDVMSERDEKGTP